MKLKIRKSSLIHRRRHGFRAKPGSHMRPRRKQKHLTRLLRRMRKVRAASNK